MHPAPSVIVFTVFSGLGFGYLACLGFGIAQPSGLAALGAYTLAYGFAVAGLVASTFHLGNPQRALRAFTQWRSSWLSREAWAAVIALVGMAPVALAAILGLALPGGIGALAGVACLGVVFATSMIYAQLKTVPRWHHWTTPALFMGFAAAGGVLLSGGAYALPLLLALGLLLAFTFHDGDGRFAARGQSMGTATGLSGSVRAFAPPHSGENYVMREMIHKVGRKHALKLRAIGVVFAAALPALVVLVLPAGLMTTALALGLHLIGAFAARWLFFAEAEHVVGLYYGQR
jgi:sulfite dehydrogenase (quinone) subunit SoeC